VPSAECRVPTDDACTFQRVRDELYLAVMPVQVQKHLFTVREFHDMVRGGVFHEDDRVELLAGEVLEMTRSGVGTPGA
jgi:hypothetical protein